MLALFLLYISKSRNAFIDIGFFKNRRSVTIIVLVALAFGIQSAFAFLFSFMAVSYTHLSIVMKYAVKKEIGGEEHGRENS